MNPKGTLWYRFILSVTGHIVFPLLGGAKIVGRENVPWEGPLIVAPNHVSFLDPPITAVAVVRALRFMAKSELFKVPVLGALIRSLNAFPLRRGENDVEAIKKAAEILKQGLALIVFPEGTRGDGRTLGPIMPSIGVFAKRSNAWVLPVGISGTFVSWPKGQKFPRRAKMRVVIGKPFRYADIEATRGDRDAREAFATELATRLAELCAQAGMPVKVSPANEPPSSSGGSEKAIVSPSSEAVEPPLQL